MACMGPALPVVCPRQSTSAIPYPYSLSVACDSISYAVDRKEMKMFAIILIHMCILITRTACQNDQKLVRHGATAEGDLKGPPSSRPPHRQLLRRSPGASDSRGGGAGEQRSQRLSVHHGGEGLPCGATAGGEGGYQLYQCRPRQQDHRSMYRRFSSNIIANFALPARSLQSRTRLINAFLACTSCYKLKGGAHQWHLNLAGRPCFSALRTAGHLF